MSRVRRFVRALVVGLVITVSGGVAAGTASADTYWTRSEPANSAPVSYQNVSLLADTYWT